ncbi:MAG TPA: hypothetical protein VMT58_07030, partial [Candidatus Binataceae bacterium]|nr:hypothetical protein [Candidatus Binataceae bacterium]
VSDRRILDSPEFGVEIASALHRLYPAKFELRDTLGAIGSRETLAAIARDDDPRSIERQWRPHIAAFQAMRAKYLLYQ